MSVKFKLSTGVEMHIPIDKVSSSKYICDLLPIFKSSDTNIVIDVPNKYTHVFRTYLSVLVCGMANNSVFDNNIDYLITCFDMESYFVDDNFFEYLIEQIRNEWNNIYKYINTMPNARSIYLHLPYDFIPDIYINNLHFFNEWISLNENKVISCNRYKDEYMTVTSYYDDDDVDHDNSEQLEKLYVHHITNGVISSGFSLEQKWYKSGGVMQIHRFHDKLQHGAQESWYESNSGIRGQNGHRKSKHNYSYGMKNGCSETWYDNGNRESEHNYSYGRENGQKIGWYKNGNLLYEYTMSSGHQRGIQKEYHSNGKLKCQYHIFNEVKHGLEQQWNEQGILEQEQLFDDGKLINKPVSKLTDFLYSLW